MKQFWERTYQITDRIIRLSNVSTMFGLGAAFIMFVMAQWCWFNPALKNDYDFQVSAFNYVKKTYAIPFDTLDDMKTKFPDCCGISQRSDFFWPLYGDTRTVYFNLRWPDFNDAMPVFEWYLVELNSCRKILNTLADIHVTLKSKRSKC